MCRVTRDPRHLGDKLCSSMMLVRVLDPILIIIMSMTMCLFCDGVVGGTPEEAHRFAGVQEVVLGVCDSRKKGRFTRSLECSAGRRQEMVLKEGRDGVRERFLKAKEELWR